MKPPAPSPSSPEPAKRPELSRGWTAAALSVTAVFLVIGFLLGRADWGQPRTPPFTRIEGIAPAPQPPATVSTGRPTPTQKEQAPPRQELPPVQVPYRTQQEAPAPSGPPAGWTPPAETGTPPAVPYGTESPPQGQGAMAGPNAPQPQPQPLPQQLPPVQGPADVVLVTPEGDRYHTQACASARGGMPVTRQQAMAAGRTPCRRCRP